MRAIRYFGQEQQVITAEALRRFPLVAVAFLVDAGEGDRMTGAVSYGILPDTGLDETEPDLVDGAVAVFGGVIGHTELLG